MKQLEKPFSAFWYGKDIEVNSTPKTSPTGDSEDDQYRLLKKAIQEEALRKWR
ncbi:hypothetical protein [Halalkalibacter lacteus]|uniref:hypothetical protein n=1 Tax=Halalkalibacter lacteus TaxID=3090663 RepID=UPI002FC65971